MVLKQSLFIKSILSFIFPNFGLLIAEEKIQQLEHIRDQLFDDADRDKNCKDYYKRSNAIEFINALEMLPCVPDSNGELRPVRDFCDPEVLLFTTFHTFFCFPPHNIRVAIGLEFLRKIGLRQKATQEVSRSFVGRCPAEITVILKKPQTLYSSIS